MLEVECQGIADNREEGLGMGGRRLVLPMDSIISVVKEGSPGRGDTQSTVVEVLSRAGNTIPVFKPYQRDWVNWSCPRGFREHFSSLSQFSSRWLRGT